MSMTLREFKGLTIGDLHCLDCEWRQGCTTVADIFECRHRRDIDKVFQRISQKDVE